MLPNGTKFNSYLIKNLLYFNKKTHTKCSLLFTPVVMAHPQKIRDKHQAILASTFSASEFFYLFSNLSIAPLHFKIPNIRNVKKK